MRSQGEREHQRVKGFYSTTNKVNYEQQIAQNVHRQRNVWKGRERNKGIPKKEDREELPPIDPSTHHQIPDSEKDVLPVHSLERHYASDWATQVCLLNKCCFTCPDTKFDRTSAESFMNIYCPELNRQTPMQSSQRKK